LLKALGVKKTHELYCEPNGKFPHNPEPLPENLSEISQLVQKSNVDMGFVVDPDVDRLAIVTDEGEMFGEEYTLVAVADYVLQHDKGNTVSNMSSTRALRDVTEKYGAKYAASAVGEVNVVVKMKETNAVIGGEGNGGVIYPALHYGRDSLVGIALFLTHLAKSGKKCSALRASYPDYFISKNKIELSPEMDVDDILEKIAEKYKAHNPSTIDGVKIDFDNEVEEFKGLSRCSLTGGAWSIEKGHLHVITNETFQLYTGPYYSKNYVVETVLTPEYGESHLLVFRSIGTERSYFFGFNGSNKAALIKRDHENTVLEEIDFPWEIGRQYILQVDAVGRLFRCSINGKEIIKFKDNNFIPSGMVGLGKLEPGRTIFKSISFSEY